MIKVFGQADTSFSSNGDVVVQPFKALVHKMDNGDFYLDFECSPDFLDYVTSNNIIVAPTPQGEQAFRIGNVSNTRRKITAKIPHLFYDSNNYLIADSNVVNTSSLSPYQYRPQGIQRPSRCATSRYPRPC